MKKIILVLILTLILVALTITTTLAYSSTLTIKWIWGEVYSEVSVIIPNVRHVPYVQLNETLDFT